MKHTRKLFATILSLVMILTALPLTAVNAFAEESGDYEYDVLEDGTAEITYYAGSATELTIPSAIDGYTVTSIGDYAFEDCESLISVTIPDSVTSIGFDAFFNCESLASITIPDSVTSIDNYAFCNTAYYNNDANWENGVLYIGKHLIGTHLATVSGSYEIKPGTKTIAGDAFWHCTSLESITIPDSVTSIGYGAFSNCTSLTSVTIPNSVISIGTYAFFNCESLASITIPDSVTSIGDWAFEDCTSLVSVTIPDSVTSIGSGTFNNCTSLASVTIPDSVTSIGAWAFEDCKSLTSVTIPNSVTSIGYGAFWNTAYYNDDANWENGVLYIGKHLIEANADTVSGSYEIKAGTKIIADDAFEDCTSLESVTIPDSVTSIGDWALYNCTSLESITIPSSVTDIGDYAFGYCDDDFGEYMKFDAGPDIPSAGPGFILIDGFTIYGYTGTEAERYATENEIKFVALEEPAKTENGDTNGDGKISVVDAKWILQTVANSRNLDENQRANADVNGDGKISVVDAKWILQAVAGMRKL